MSMCAILDTTYPSESTLCMRLFYFTGSLTSGEHVEGNHSL